MTTKDKAQPAKVKDYWEKIAADFDTIYSGKKTGWSRFLDRVFRKDMYDRLRLTLEECSDKDIRSVLDVGAGTGRFCLPLAEDKDRVLGIDFSKPMIELARKLAEEAGVADKVEFQVGDFLDLDFEETFDAIISIGVFDYIKDPLPFLGKMAKVANKRVVTSWPALWTWRVIPRWIRLNLAGCPVYFFTTSKIEEYHRESGLRVLSLKRVGKIFLAVAEPERTAGDDQ